MSFNSVVPVIITGKKGYVYNQRYCKRCELWWNYESLPNPNRCPSPRCNTKLRVRRKDNYSREKQKLRRIKYGIAR